MEALGADFPQRVHDEYSHFFTGPVAQWIRHRPTEPGIAGSSPAGVMFVLRHAAGESFGDARLDGILG